MNTNAQLAADCIANLINTGGVVLEDGKISTAEYFPILSALSGLSVVLPVRKEAVAEWEAQTAEEKAAMIKRATDKIDLKDDKTEAKFEAGFGILVHLGTILA